jgi:hypothetical protein
VVDPVLIPIIAIICGPIIAMGLPIARAYARRLDAAPAQPTLPPELTARLERMEQAMDAIAIEVERISEGQRFTTRLLAERSQPAALAANDGSERTREYQ